MSRAPQSGAWRLAKRRLRGVEDVVAASVLTTAVSTLLLFALIIMAPHMYSKAVEVPAAPGEDVPHLYVYVYKHGGSLYAVEYEGRDVEAFRKAIGIPGRLVAIFDVYPGGYRCTKYVGYPVRIGRDPYVGLWCPPPFEPRDVSSCAPIGVTSRGRWLLVQYRCP